MVDLISIGLQFRQWANMFVAEWGYLGIFFISLIGNASIILPVPAFAVVWMMGSQMNPWILGIVAGAGAAIGEMTGYALGMGGRAVIQKKHKRMLEKTKKWVEKHGMFSIIVFFAATPFPDDIVGILGGVIKYNIKRFLLASFIGKALLHVAIAWFGYASSLIFGQWLFDLSSVIFALLLFVIFILVIHNIVIKVLIEKGYIKAPQKS